MAKFIILRLLAALAFCALALSNQALASSTCSSSFYSQYQSCLLSPGSCSPYASPQEFVAAHPGCFPGGSSAAQAQVSASSFQQVGAISTAITGRMLGGSGPTQVAGTDVQGMAAGGKNAWNVWGSVAQNDTRQAFTIGINQIKNDLNVTNVVVGGDYSISPGLVLGVSGAFDRGEGSMQPTAVAARDASTTKGWAVAPYLGYQLSKEFSLDASVGVGSGKTSGAGNMESEGDRLFYAANLNYSRWVKDFQFTGKLGYLHGEEDFGNTKVNGATMNNTAAKNKLDRLLFGAQVAYWMGNGAQPYAGLNYLSDRRSSSQAGTDPVGKSAWQWALGVNFFSLANGVNGGVAYTQEEGRSNQKNNAFSANLGIRF